MDWDYGERRRRERNYRLMFKSALACAALGVALTVGGGIAALAGTDSFFLAFGLMLVALAGVSAYLTLASTVKIIEMDAQEFHKR